MAGTKPNRQGKGHLNVHRPRHRYYLRSTCRNVPGSGSQFAGGLDLFSEAGDSCLVCMTSMLFDGSVRSASGESHLAEVHPLGGFCRV